MPTEPGHPRDTEVEFTSPSVTWVVCAAVPLRGDAVLFDDRELGLEPRGVLLRQLGLRTEMHGTRDERDGADKGDESTAEDLHGGPEARQILL